MPFLGSTLLFLPESWIMRRIPMGKYVTASGRRHVCTCVQSHCVRGGGGMQPWQREFRHVETSHVVHRMCRAEHSFFGACFCSCPRNQHANLVVSARTFVSVATYRQATWRCTGSPLRGTHPRPECPKERQAISSSCMSKQDGNQDSRSRFRSGRAISMQERKMFLAGVVWYGYWVEVCERLHRRPVRPYGGEKTYSC